MKHVVFEGVDFGGKGICIDAIAGFERDSGTTVFNLDRFQKRRGRNPVPEELTDDVGMIVYSEPTYAGAGKLIRDELIKNNGRNYSVEVIAAAFALDRRILFEGFLGQMKIKTPEVKLLGSRGIVSSMVYQGMQFAEERNINLYEAIMQVLNIDGNEYVYDNHMPDTLVITTVGDAGELMERAKNREKDDDSIYENFRTLSQLSRIYKSEDITKILDGMTRVKNINASISPEYTVSEALRLWHEFTE